MEYIWSLIDWLYDEANWTIIRVSIALLSVPGAIWGAHLFILWLRNRGIDRRVDGINQTLQRLQSTLDGSALYDRRVVSQAEAIAPKPTQNIESAVDRDRRVGEAFALLRQGKPFDFGWGDYLLVAYSKQREDLKNKAMEVNAENMFGTPENPTQLRRVIKDLLIAGMGEREVVIRCHLPPGHLALKGLEATVNVNRR